MYTLNINCKGKRTVGKGDKGINVEKNVIGLKKLKVKIIKKRKNGRRKKKGKCPRTAKAQHKGRGL